MKACHEFYELMFNAKYQIPDLYLELALPVVWTAAIVASLVPLVLYAYSQRYFVNTLAGAIKG